MVNNEKIFTVLLVGVLIITNSISAHGENAGRTDLSTLQELINEGNLITDYSSSDAYVWVTKVLNFNEKYVASYVYSDIKNQCNAAKGYSSISTFNVDSQILADLTLLYNETPVSTELQEIRIKKQPTKVIYEEGEIFSTTGMEVLATYLYTYEDNSKDIEERIVTNFIVDKMMPLNYGDTFVAISYEDNGIIKTAIQNITVTPIIVSKVLKSISIVTPPVKTVYKEGETFNKAGMKVNAKYEQVWSDGSHGEGECENVAYTVDTITPLSAQDNSITISYEDDGITQTAEQRIVVES